MRMLAAVLVLVAIAPPAVAQPPADDDRTPLPAWLANSYFNVNVGSLAQSFTARQLEPGFHVDSVDEPRLAARVVLFGHEFTPYVSAQLTYMRPVQFVSYRDVNGDGRGHHVWTGFGGATVR